MGLIRRRRLPPANLKQRKAQKVTSPNVAVQDEPLCQGPGLRVGNPTRLVIDLLSEPAW